MLNSETENRMVVTRGWYNIICKSCGSGRGACTRCGDNVQYAPRQLGLTEPRI